MKKILIFHSNQQSIAELQSNLTGRCDFYATSQRKTALEFLKNNPVDCLVLHLPTEFDKAMKRESLKLLKKVKKGAFKNLTRIIVCSNHDQQQVKDYLKRGVTAIVADGRALRVVLGV